MANRYARPVGGNWTDNATWSTTSGGAADTVAPTASDDVFLDANSGNVTISATSVGKSLTCTGYTGTLTHNAFNLTINGNITFASGMTYAGTGTLVHTGITGSTVGLIFDGTVTWTGALSFSIASGTAFINLTTNGKLLTTISLGGTGTADSVILQDNLSFTAQKTNTIIITSSSGNRINLNGFTISGNSDTNRLLIRTSTLGTARTITNTTGTFANADFRDITFSTAADYSAITGLSGDCGGNTNATFTTAATQTYTGGTGSWSDNTKWTSRVPLPQDNVLMSGVTGGTITADMPRLGKSIDWTGAAGTPTFGVSVAHTIYGSLTLISGMTFSTAVGATTFEGRDTQTLTMAGKSFGNSVTIQMVGGTLTLQDAYLHSTNAFNVLNGTFNTNNFNMTISGANGSFNSSGSSTRTLNLGSSTITLSSSTVQSVFSIASSATVNAGTSTVIISDTGAGAKTFAGGGKTYNDLKISGGGAGAVILTGANTFNRIYTDGGGTKSITLPGSTTTTILSGQGLGNGTNVITFTSSAGTATLSKTTAGTLQWPYVNLTNIAATQTSKFYAPLSTDGGGNTNWIFGYAPVVGGVGTGRANRIAIGLMI